MPNTEVNPTEYQNKHSKSITLDTYNGIANDLMSLNTPLADRFMQVSDMRSDITIIQKPQDRVRDYEEVGFVKVAKFLKMPRFDIWGNKDTITQVKRENDTWLIAVSDQDLADKAARSDGDKKFADRFIDAFNTEVNQGLMTCLKREKFLNNGKYNPAFLTGHISLSMNLFAISSMFIMAIISRDSRLATAFGTYALTQTVLLNLVYNSLNRIHTEKNLRHVYYSNPFLNESNYDDPFIKHSLPEFLLPGVPVDRYLRGYAYLKNYGKDLITIG